MNSVASGMHCVKVVEDIVVKSSRSLSHLLMSFLFSLEYCRRSVDRRNVVNLQCDFINWGVAKGI